jgi:hypothetical protein
LQRHLELDRTAGPVARERDPGSGGAEPDELLVGPRPGREALGADVERLEQVRLAGPVRARDEDDPGLQCELEPFVGAEVAEGDRSDDQARFSYPASLIGMIR